MPPSAGSGGGPHVLACAALLPDLVTAAASLASLAPFDADGPDYFAGMGEDNVDDIRRYRADEAAARVKADQDREELLAASPGDAAKGMESLLTPTDAALLSGELAGYLTSSMRDGLAPGSQGWWDDYCTIRPWGFDLAGIAIPVLLLHGRQDMFVPFGHGQWPAAHIPGVEARLLDDDGHLTLLQNRIPEVHAWLSEHLQRTSERA
jgi:pimeloyl-ACP methyl ester carboxylesterase